MILFELCLSNFFLLQKGDIASIKAATWGRTQTCKVLVEAGAEIDAQNKVSIRLIMILTKSL